MLPNQIHEPGTIAVFDALNNSAKKIKTVFDVGALYGYFSLLSLSIFDTANIYSFEMNPFSFEAMKNNIALNVHLDLSRIKLLNYALSDCNKFRKPYIVNKFYLREATQFERLKNNISIFKHNINWMTNQLVGNTLQKRQKRLSYLDFMSIDNFCDQHKILPDLIKIDVEGYQAKIIPGAMKTIEKSKPFIIIEFDDAKATNMIFGSSNKEIIEPLFNLGYQLAWGKHRNNKGIFEALGYSDLDSSHECNSLGVLWVEKRLKQN